MRISCPPHRFACHYGIDFPDHEKLLANQLSHEKICEYLGADSLGYLDVAGMVRATGLQPKAAEYGGVSIRKQIVLAMSISGGLAGMVGINEVLGYRHVYYDGFSANYGFVGIAVALLGRNHPVGVFLAAILFAILLRGGIFVDAFTGHVSKDIVDMLQGIVIVFVAAEAMFRGPLKKFGLMKKAKI